MSEYKHCRATIELRDTLRYTGHGPSGFEMHYTRRQCQRFVTASDDYCWQHRTAAASGPPGGAGSGDE